MKYYMFKEPYVALIKAPNENEAIEKYNKEVCSDDEKLEFKEITQVQAIYIAKKAIDENPQDFFGDWDSLVNKEAENYITSTTGTITLLVDGRLF